MAIRPATPTDLPAILAITNDMITTSTASYFDEPLTLENRQAWLADRGKLGYPVLVAEIDGTVAGYASFGDFRAWPGYRYTVEHSVALARPFRGQGIGRSLVAALLPIAHGLGKHIMIAGVDAENGGSIRFHERLGFERVAHLKEVGHKFGRWLDLVLLQKFLDAPGSGR